MDTRFIWNYFDRKVCLTLDNNRPSGKPSRWPNAEKEFNRVSLKDVIKFTALPGIGPHQSFTLSQKKILQDFIASDSHRLLTLEDDVEFTGLYSLHDAIYDIQVNNIEWDVLYLGGNIQGDAKKKRRNLYQVYNVWTTHAVAYTSKAAEFLLSNFPNENERMYDNYLGDCLPQMKAYMVAPMVAVQRPDYSDIWKSDVNYQEIFNASNNKLK